MPTPTQEIVSSLKHFGLLLKQDKNLPNVVTLLTGQALSTSWWSHPKAGLIFSVLSELADHPDVLFTKLLHRKDTLVDRSLWADFLTVATAGEQWQWRGLSSRARSLFEAAMTAGGPLRSSGPTVKELTSRLLVHSVEVHTESGRHEMALEPWSVWAARSRTAPKGSVVQARKALEGACQGLGAPIEALPWQSRTSNRSLL